MLRILVAVVWFIAAYKWGDWRNWRKYYSTFQFWIIGSLVQMLVTYNHPLWILTSPLIRSGTLNSLFINFFYFPAMSLIFLKHLPQNSKPRMFIYLAFWIMLSSLKELFFYANGYVIYRNNWNFPWSVAFNCYMFPLLMIHYKKPPVAWILALAMGISIFLLFKIPLSSLK